MSNSKCLICQIKPKITLCICCNILYCSVECLLKDNLNKQITKCFKHKRRLEEEKEEKENPGIKKQKILIPLLHLVRLTKHNQSNRFTKEKLEYLKNLIQGTSEWKDEQSNFFSTSKFEYCTFPKRGTIIDSWRLLTGRIIRDESTELEKEILGNGIILEPLVRTITSKLLNKIIREYGIIVYKKYNLFSCSTDGIVASDEDPEIDGDTCIEIKCPFYTMHKDLVPPNYMPQVQSAIKILKVKFCLFICFFMDKKNREKAICEKKVATIRISKVYKNKEYCNWMFKRAFYFTDCIIDDIEPTLLNIPKEEEIPKVKIEPVFEDSTILIDIINEKYELLTF